MEVYELSCQYDARQSFYGKAHVYVDGTKSTLTSYGTEVASFDKNTRVFEIYGFYSQTTLRHQVEFYRQMTGNYQCNKKTLSMFLVRK